MLKHGQISSCRNQSGINFSEIINKVIIELRPGRVQREGEEHLGASQVTFGHSAKPFHVRPEIKEN
jgi:hypothetical protein